MHIFTEEHTPAQIVKEFPKASDLFKFHGINFCCKGDIELKKTFDHKNVEGSNILTELNGAYDEWLSKGNKAINWDTKSLTDITNYIKEHYHTYLQDELSALGEFVTRIYRVHGEDSLHLKELYSLYNEFLIEAEIHLVKETTEVIPMIQKSETINHHHISKEIEVLKDGNETMIQLLNKMRTTTNEFVPPLDACGSYRITYARLLELETEMMDYIHLENNILFERFAS